MWEVKSDAIGPKRGKLVGRSLQSEIAKTSRFKDRNLVEKIPFIFENNVIHVFRTLPYNNITIMASYDSTSMRRNRENNTTK